MTPKQELIIIKSPKEIDELILYLQQFDLIAFDTETTGVHKGAEIIGMSFCAEEHKAYYLVLQEWIHERTGRGPGHLAPSWIGIKAYTSILIEFIKTKSLIMHNGLFDCAMVEDNFGISLINSLHTDTMIAAHLLDENRRIGLKELGIHYFGSSADAESKAVEESARANGATWTKDNKEFYKCDSQILAEYGAKDALLTYKLFLEMVPELYEQNLADFFYKDESMPLLRGPTYEMNTTGLKIDQQGQLQLKKTLQAECAEAKTFIYAEIDKHIKEKYPGTTKNNTFNIGATQQLSWLLFGQLNLEFNTLTKAGKTICKELGLKLPYTTSAKRQFISECLDKAGTIQKPEYKTLTKTVKAKNFKQPWAYIAVDKKTLAKLAPKHKWIAKLLEYNKKMKMLSTYIEGLEERIQYGIIRPSFLQHGTKTGRYASRNPNFQNLPRDDKRIKGLVVARPGKVFVGADQSQLEPRIFAYYSNDSRLLGAFRGTDDFYSTIGMEVYKKTDCTPKKEGSSEAFGVKYKQLRDMSKTIALAATYGATAHQLAPITGKSIDDTQADIDNYFETFPGVKQYQLDSHEKVKKDGYIDNLFGRRRRIPEVVEISKLYKKLPHSELPYEARKLLNLAVNFPIQSTGASIVNRSAIAFHNMKLAAGIDCQMVCQVHDSLIIECNEQDAESVSLLLQTAMESTIDLKTVKLEAIPRIGKNLAEV